MNQNVPMLQRQLKTAQYMLLATVIATVVNIVLLLSRSDMYIPYCAAAAYYLILLGYYFDALTLSTYTATAMVMAFVILALWLLVWWKAKRSTAWLKVGMILSIVDTVAFGAYVFLFTQDPIFNLLEGVMHIAVIYEIYVGLKAAKALAQAKEGPRQPPFDPFDDPTPTQIQYTDEIE